MKKRQISLLIFWCCCFLIGVVLIVIPVSNRWNAYISEQTIGAYNHGVQKMDHQIWIVPAEQARAYNGTLNEPSVPDAFSVVTAFGIPTMKNCELNRGGIMGYISIPSIHVNCRFIITRRRP